MRIGLFVGLNGPISFGEALASAQQAEQHGFDSFWLPNIFGLDALTTLAVIAGKTERIELGSNVVPVYPRHPLALAQQALTASVFAEGRLTLGIGLSHKIIIEKMFGYSFDKPARYMREYLMALNPLLAGETVRFRGEVLRAAGALTVPDAPVPPVLIAAMGPHMLQIAGAMSAGTLLGWAGPINVSEFMAPAIRAAAEKAGRPAPRIGTALPVCVTDEPEAARRMAAELFLVYDSVPSYRTILDRESKATVADAAIVGPEEVVQEGLAELQAAGVTDFAAAVFAASPEERDRTMAFLSASRATPPPAAIP
jgi:F420-dependent oxidoreductase-like protein